ncbi:MULTISPECIES: DUF896 domain-containing protein [unclassified Thermoactinomyces]|nr:DUF896 domain-containing protein [Thermoactinomyces sp. CICC 24227]
MINEQLIQQINELACKKRTQGLTEEKRNKPSCIRFT